MYILAQDWASKWARYSPHKTAFKDYFSGNTLSFLQLNKAANALAHYFSSVYQLEKGDRVAVLTENCLEYLVLFAVAQKTGIILVPLNYRLKAAELDYMLKDATPSLLITEEKLQKEIKNTSFAKEIKHHWPLNSLADFCNTHKDAQTKGSFPLTPLLEDDPIFILYTSGTTGFPKGAIYSHKMLFWNSVNTSMSLIIDTESRTVNCMPPFHTGGWNVLTTPFFHHGGYSCIMKSFDPSITLALLEAERPTIFMAVPTMLKMMADEPNFEQVDLSSLKYIIVGGESMPIPLIERWHQKGVPIRQGYGMTEVGPNLTSLHHDDAISKKGSIGRSNYYVDIRLVDPSGKEVQANEAGELLLRGPMVTPGYWQNPEATQKTIKDNWFHTGDMACQDEEGYLYIVDRIKNMFISGGENVYPAEVERTIIQHPNVSEVAVVGIPHPKWGEVGKAYIVCKETMNSAELIAFCKDRLAKFKVPKEVAFVSSIPKTNTGKIDRKAVKSLT